MSGDPVVLTIVQGTDFNSTIDLIASDIFLTDSPTGTTRGKDADPKK